MENDTENEIILAPCYAGRLASAYGISPKILRSWLRAHGIHLKSNAAKYSLKEVITIVECIGLPPCSIY